MGPYGEGAPPALLAAVAAAVVRADSGSATADGRCPLSVPGGGLGGWGECAPFLNAGESVTGDHPLHVAGRRAEKLGGVSQLRCGAVERSPTLFNARPLVGVLTLPTMLLTDRHSAAVLSPNTRPDSLLRSVALSHAVRRSRGETGRARVRASMRGRLEEMLTVCHDRPSRRWGGYGGDGPQRR